MEEVEELKDDALSKSGYNLLCTTTIITSVSHLE